MIKLQLQWVAQSQFAGYFAAVDLGFYEDEGLDVTILEGAVEIVPQQVVASGGAQFGLAWVPKVLESNEQGVNLVNIAQVFQRSGTLEVSFVDTGIESVEDFAGMRIGTSAPGASATSTNSLPPCAQLVSTRKTPMTSPSFNSLLTCRCC